MKYKKQKRFLVIGGGDIQNNDNDDIIEENRIPLKTNKTNKIEKKMVVPNFRKPVDVHKNNIRIVF